MMLQTTLLETLNKLPESLQQEVLHYAEFLAEKYAKAEPPAEMPKKPRQAGTMKGTFILPLPDDFDEPLEDFQEYMCSFASPKLRARQGDFDSILPHS